MMLVGEERQLSNISPFKNKSYAKACQTWVQVLAGFCFAILILLVTGLFLS